jgi:hypothetical protein
MMHFIILFAIATLFITAGIGLLGTINALRKNQPGCSGNHDCVTYKGEKIQCPSCELKEYQAQLAGQKSGCSSGCASKTL